jgi:hypothetical protein
MPSILLDMSQDMHFLKSCCMLFVTTYSSFSQKCKSTYIILYTLYGCGSNCKIGLRMKIHYPSYMGVEDGCFKVRICLCQCLC